MQPSDTTALPSVKIFQQDSSQQNESQKHFESHMSSVQELKDVSIDLEPRVSSIWKKPLPKIV